MPSVHNRFERDVARSATPLKRPVSLQEKLLDFGLGMIYYHTGGDIMAASKIAITIDDKLVKQLDNLVNSQVFPNRSKAIQKAVEEKLERIEKTRLSRECAKLDPKYEQTLAEEGFSKELEEWPEY
jgi:Arc/MetJ-type ribon-helix-helix transcriptional regulator